MKKLTIFITVLILGLSFSTIVSANMNNGHKVVPMVKTYDLDKKDDNGHWLFECSECFSIGCGISDCGYNFAGIVWYCFIKRCLLSFENTRTDVSCWNRCERRIWIRVWSIYANFKLW